jgi:PAS domain S-box-containing protein
MNQSKKTKQELETELRILQNKYDCLKTKCEEDINRYKQVETSLLDIEKKFRVIAENTYDTIAVFDLNYNLIYVSPTVKKTHGYTPEEAIKLKLEQILTPGSLQLVHELNKAILPGIFAGTDHTEIFKPIELEQYVKNGSTIWSEVSFAFLKDQNNLPEGIVTISRNITEYKKAEEALRKSEERFKTLSSLSTEGVMIHEEGIIIEANVAFAGLLGFARPEDIIGKHGLEITNFTEESRRKVEYNLRTKSTETIDGELLTLEGKTIYVETKGFPVFYQGREARLVVMRDISERKKAENNLRASVSLLDASLESTADGILIVNSERMITKWNHKFIKMWHLTEEILSKNDDATVINLILQQLSNPQAFIDKVQYLYDHPEESSFDLICFLDGRIFERYSQSQRIGDEIIGRVWSFRDISERKKAEESLSMLAHAIRCISESVSITDRMNNIIYVNEAFMKTYQYKEQELLGQNIGIVRTQNNTSVLADDILLSTIDGGWQGELVNRRKDGSEFPVHISTSVIRNENQEAIALIGVANDITERKKEEKELIRAKENAEESDRLKSAFLANMSHEIRTPMNGILGFAGLLKEPGLSGEDRAEFIRMIEKSGERMLNIINDIIDISKIEAGVIKLDIKETNINEQLDYIYTFFKPEVEGKGMKLFHKKTLSDKNAIINTDREKLFAILTNLVKNAIKYSYEGFIEFGYQLKSQNDLSYLEFYVKDTGIGIPHDRQEAIFERFIQADIVDKMALQGAGLGLSIAKAFVELLDGKIWVESQNGKGSIFRFSIPYNASYSEKNTYRNRVISEGPENKIDNLKILIAEDDEISSMLLAFEFKKFSREILKARTGNEAVEICIKNTDLDLILMDIQMPEMSGYEATKKIREYNKEIVIIAQTAYGLSGDREKAIEAGCDDYISKPISQNELARLLQKYFP